MYKLLITGDTNDADCVTSISDVTKEQLEQLEPVFAAIKAFKPYKGKCDGMEFTHSHNWPSGEFYPREDLGEKFPKEIYEGILTPGQIEMFDDLCPHDCGGIHSIVGIQVLEVVKEEVYLSR